jgi:uncharacterized protein YbjT (DUF2867 family)
VKHHVALSVVGTERPLGIGYFRAKQAQEKLIKASGIPYTILHSTQFFNSSTASSSRARKTAPSMCRPLWYSRLPPTMSPPRWQNSPWGRH